MALFFEFAYSKVFQHKAKQIIFTGLCEIESGFIVPKIINLFWNKSVGEE
jgi:hypothetical protein